MRKFVFADEAGDFEFSPKPRASKYFILCTITLDTCDIGHRLLALRRQLVWEKAPVGACFHASEDRQVIRDRVFDLIRAEPVRIDATVMEKRKAQPQLRATNA